MITLSMLITEGQEHGGENTELLQKKVDWPGVPREGDLVQVTTADDGGFNAYVKHVYWGDDGNIQVDLRTMIVDPTEVTQKMAGYGSFAKYCSAWYTTTDGPRPDERMIEHGWEMWTP
jgi:hypothetical protein